MQKVQVRVAVIVREDGSWSAFGLHGESDSEVIDVAEGGFPDDSLGAKIYFLTAALDLPVIPVVEAEIS